MAESVKDKAFESYDVEAISLVDVINFLLVWWKVIILMGAVATLAAWFYLKTISPLYEAQAIIAMAKIPASNSESTISPSNGFIDVESPTLLAERMSLPTAFSTVAVKACEFSNAHVLMSHFKIMSQNNLNSTLRFSVLHHSPRLAEKCVGAIVEMIREQQAELVRPVSESMRQAISEVQNLLHEEYGSEKHRSEQPGAYEIYVERGREALLSVLVLQKTRQAMLADVGTRMVTPIYASENPVSPRKFHLLLSWGSVGLFCGLLTGLVWNLVVQFRRRI